MASSPTTSVRSKSRSPQPKRHSRSRNSSRQKSPRDQSALKYVKKTVSWIYTRLKSAPRDIWGLFLILLSALFFLSFTTPFIGPAGRFFHLGIRDLLGWGSWLFIVEVLIIGLVILWNPESFGDSDIGEADNNKKILTSLFAGFTIALVATVGLADVLGSTLSLSSDLNQLRSSGGILGAVVGSPLGRLFGTIGSSTIFAVIAIIGLMLVSGHTFKDLVTSIINLLKGIKRQSPVVEAEELEPKVKKRPRVKKEIEEIDQETTQAEEPIEELDPIVDDHDSQVEAPVFPEEPEVGVANQLSFNIGDVAVAKWKLPPISLLLHSEAARLDREAVDAAGTQLVSALLTHGVETVLVGATVGPTVTRYELELGAGVKVARVTSLSKDIAYAMASPDVRILAPIPGRSAIGVEVPNRVRQLVTLGDLITTKEAKSSRHPLEIPLGRDIAGRTIISNLAEMPHLLIAGATGAGKSSCINSMVTSLLMRSTPEDVKLILIDPKRVELGQYNGLPHLLTEVVVNPKKAAGVLNWAVKEMERRYDLLAEVGVRDITSYQAILKSGTLPALETDEESLDVDLEAENEDVEPDATELSELQEEATTTMPERLPYIVIIVDELNDLMMVAARDVEESICRIAQMARAVGIHLVIATQRPSVDVITGVIKANIPSRLAFSVSSLADSRVILDQAGAERLIGRGDMLLLTASSSSPRRIQGPWVTEKEVHAVVGHWRRQSSPAFIEELSSEEQVFGNYSSADDDDELLQAAMELVVRSGLGSTSMLQRKLRVGFARAGRLMDLLERKGIVGPSEGSKARTVHMTPEELDAIIDAS